jgi:putative chitinase
LWATRSPSSIPRRRWRANYAAAGKALGLDLVNQPELAARPENAARVAAWYWNSRGLNAVADRGDFREVTRRINGGYNHMPERRAYFARAQAIVD